MIPTLTEATALGRNRHIHKFILPLYENTFARLILILWPSKILPFHSIPKEFVVLLFFRGHYTFCALMSSTEKKNGEFDDYLLRGPTTFMEALCQI